MIKMIIGRCSFFMAQCVTLHLQGRTGHTQYLSRLHDFARGLPRFNIASRAAEKQKERRMQFLYLLTPARIEMVTAGPTPEEQAIVSEHFAHLEALTEQDVMLLVGRTQDNSPRTFGIGQ